MKTIFSIINKKEGLDMQTFLFSVSVFLAGVLSFFSPCIFPLLPVYIGILLDSEDKPRTVRFLGREIAWYGLVKTLCFILLGSAMLWVSSLSYLVFTKWN